MVKFTKNIWTVAVLLLLFCAGGLIADAAAIQNGMIRLHVVADSDGEEDQAIKLAVRDSVISYLQDRMKDIDNAEYAMAHLKNELPNIAHVANETLNQLGSDDHATVMLTKEEFSTRDYDTFSLPAGVYDSLRICIGSGNGKNWWCVVFPSLCIPATTDGFKTAAVSSGFDQGLTNTMAGETGYEIRFFLLDCIGKIENFLHFG